MLFQTRSYFVWRTRSRRAKLSDTRRVVSTVESRKYDAYAEYMQPMLGERASRYHLIELERALVSVAGFLSQRRFPLPFDPVLAVERQIAQQQKQREIEE
jgi:hypothetical protein